MAPASEPPAADEAPQEQADDNHHDEFRDADRAEIHEQTLRAQAQYAKSFRAPFVADVQMTGRASGHAKSRAEEEAREETLDGMPSAHPSATPR